MCQKSNICLCGRLTGTKFSLQRKMKRDLIKRVVESMWVLMYYV